MILTFTDFGVTGPYRGQMHAVLATLSAGVPIVELMNDAPRFQPKASGYLLAALARRLPPGGVVVAVVDPGVGGPRDALAVYADRIWYVGPHNGLLELVSCRASELRVWRIDWRPAELSTSFHGRDLFAPVAARLCNRPDSITEMASEIEFVPQDWPSNLSEVIYVDGFGNAISGLSADSLHQQDLLRAGGRAMSSAVTFSAVPRGAPFWYRNSLDLVEIAVNCGNAAEQLGLEVGSLVEKVSG